MEVASIVKSNYQLSQYSQKSKSTIEKRVYLNIRLRLETRKYVSLTPYLTTGNKHLPPLRSFKSGTGVLRLILSGLDKRLL